MGTRVGPVIEDIEQLGINVIRGLAMDAPQQANSGHPGTAMALAPLAHVLFTRVMRHDPQEPNWPDRDRFVLSAGHASILLYSMLYLHGYDLTLEDLHDFRQLGSKTPGHPEYRHTAGVEMTTGPLGQGFASAVGMGISERRLRSRFGSEVCDHHTFVICGDGDLQEGISHEAASLAGHLGLGRLVYVYDDNHITIDGPSELSLSDDAPGRFRSYGWHVNDIGDVANDCDALEAALRSAMAVEDAPSLIVLRSHIGWPSPNRTDTNKAHGDPFGAEEIAATKEILGLPVDETFWVPDEVVDFYKNSTVKHHKEQLAWQARFSEWNGDKAEYEACIAGTGLSGWETKLPTWDAGERVATRKASGAILKTIADVVPGLIGGGADLTGNTGTELSGYGTQSAEDPSGRQIYFGVREHAMGAVMNGMALHGGTLPFGGTFFVFSDYMRPAIRLAALMGTKVIYSFTHDSVGLGEDGPTHQPVEHLASLRAMPGLSVLRPADANESAEAWRIAINSAGAVALILSRQDLPVLAGTAGNEGVGRGAYVLIPSDSPTPDLVLVGTGSEVSLCVEAGAVLKAQGVDVQVVSMPSWDLFELQAEHYRDHIFPVNAAILAVEAGSSFGWERYADDVIAIDRFGLSAPGTVALKELGFSVDNVVERAKNLLADLQEDDS